MGKMNAYKKEFEDLTFRDDFMFGKTMEDPVLCHDVLECLLGRPVGELKEVQTQRGYQYTSDGKPIKLDVYSVDDLGEIYDAEMQNKNHNSQQSLSLPKRSRFYQGAIDIDFMDKGGQYKNLPASNVIFICTFDPYAMGLPVYTFRERCDEIPEMVMGDATEKKFYNATYDGNDISDDVRDLFEYIRTGKANDDLTQRIDNAVVKGRKNEVWRTQYVKERVLFQELKEEAREEGRAEGREEGRAEGREEGRAEGREEGRAEGREEGRAEGREEGRAEERRNTERERKRADEAEAARDAAVAKIKELEAQIAALK